VPALGDGSAIVVTVRWSRRWSGRRNATGAEAMTTTRPVIALRAQAGPCARKPRPPHGGHAGRSPLWPAVHVYDDNCWREVLELVDGTSPYALTGAVFARDRGALAEVADVLRHAAGTATSTTSPPAPSSASSPSAGRGAAAPTTRRARR